MEEKITKHKHPSVLSPRIFEPESALYLYFFNSSSPFLPINVFRYPLLGILHPQRGPHIALQRHKLIELAINGCSIPLLILGIKPARAIILELEPQLNGIELGMQLQIRDIRNTYEIEHHEEVRSEVNILFVVDQLVGVLNPVPRVFQRSDDVWVLVFVAVYFYRDWLELLEHEFVREEAHVLVDEDF